LPALELVECVFGRLLGFFGVAIPTHYSGEQGVRRRLGR
jgi:hypothetical protein